ncbi:hypothetical protein KSZ_19490 [Dictyobacter formicarum]|uniref:Uncharacterized protein n=1 Tax=Dictyobacter formicarum TaxID=2778368 RepID=A0ABQ3VEX5_9CHLR|nr:hypothetical protein KSZ_19490 [Dictyobacter formicarum]
MDVIRVELLILYLVKASRTDIPQFAIDDENVLKNIYIRTIHIYMVGIAKLRYICSIAIAIFEDYEGECSNSRCAAEYVV